MKIYIKSSSRIDGAIPQSVIALSELYNVTDPEDYRKLQVAVDEFKSDLKKFPSQNSVDSLDSRYDEDKGKFYRKYLPLLDKCKELENISIGGYGKYDFIKTAARKLAKQVINLYPAGWKMYQ